MNREENFDKVLSQHKIDRVSFYRFRARYPRLHGKNARLSYHGFGGEVTVAKVYTDQGACGWGELSESLADAKEAAQRVAGKRLTDVFSAGTGILDDSLKALDIPLHDLAGVIPVSYTHLIWAPEQPGRAWIFVTRSPSCWAITFTTRSRWTRCTTSWKRRYSASFTR